MLPCRKNRIAGLAFVLSVAWAIGHLSADAGAPTDTKTPQSESPRGSAQPATLAAQPVKRAKLQPLSEAATHFKGGILGDRCDKNIANLFGKINVNAFFPVFENGIGPGDYRPEIIAEYLDSAAAIYRHTGNREHLERLQRLAKSALSGQRADGYLGACKPGTEFIAPVRWNFGIWNHHLMMYGLLSYYEVAQDRTVLDAVGRGGDFVAAGFMNPGGHDLLKGSHGGMHNSCGLLALARLARSTGKQSHSDYCKFIIGKLEESKSLRVISDADDWKKISCKKAAEICLFYQGVVDLYRLTGDAAYLDAAAKYWDSIVRSQIGPTGNGGIGEYWTTRSRGLNLEQKNKPNENCIAGWWMKLAMDLLQETGNGAYADAFERTLYNDLLAHQAVDGRDFAYYQAEAGKKIQVTRGAQALCCRYRGMNLLALLPKYVVMAMADGPAVNLYAASESELEAAGVRVKVSQKTNYPADGDVEIKVQPQRDARFALYLRRPAWCRDFQVRVNGEAAKADAGANGFVRIERSWSAQGDTVHVGMEMSIAIVRERMTDNALYVDRDCIAVMRGPLAMALDSHYGVGIREAEILLDGDKVKVQPCKDTGSLNPMVRCSVSGFANGNPVDLTLVDYASAATTAPANDEFTVWIPLKARAATGQNAQR